MQKHIFLGPMTGWTLILSQSSAFLFNISRRGRVMVWIIKTYKFRLKWVTKSVLRSIHKIGNTREQLFYAWRSFHFNENAETLDSYTTCIRQVATLLGYGKPQVSEGFKNTCPTWLYWVLFPIEEWRLVVQTAKRILTKEKIHRQLAGQSSLTPFMSIKEGYNSKKVTFDT